MAGLICTRNRSSEISHRAHLRPPAFHGEPTAET
jgi:hypothetical protein